MILRHNLITSYHGSVIMCDDESNAEKSNGAGMAAMIRLHEAVKRFSGEDGQNISVWLRQLNLVAGIQKNY